MKTIILSSKGLRNLVNSSYSGNVFTIFFGSKKCELSNNYAEFISPKVSKIHRNDNTIDSMRFDFNLDEFSEIFSDDILAILKKLSSGNPIEINENQSFMLQIISLMLENDELLDIVIDNFPNFVNETNFDERLNYLKLYHHFLEQNENKKHQELIDYISSHFHSIEKNKLLRFSRPILLMILSNENLKLESEDSLFDFINQIYSNSESNNNNDDIEMQKFYSCIDFSELSDEKLKAIFQSIDSTKMTDELWKKICESYRIDIHSKKQSNQSRYTFVRKNFIFDGDSQNSFSGILAHLTNESNGNVHDNGTIVVTSSSVFSNDYHPKNAVDFNNNSKFFCSANQPNSWICYDFKDRKVQPSFYTIRTRIDGDATHHHPKFWVIEGSNDESDWKVLDTRNDITSLHLKNTVQTFKIQTRLSLNESFRFLRFRQTGLSSAGYNYLNFAALEYFGFLYEK